MKYHIENTHFYYYTSFIILIFFCLFSLLSGKHRTTKTDILGVVLSYLDSNVSQEAYDTRIYNPPPPPELKERLNNGRNIKPDSIIKNLRPLRLFINDSIRFSQDFILKEGPIEGFSFIKDIAKSKKQTIFLDIRSLKVKKGIVYNSINEDKFGKLYPNIRLQNDYGGLLSFQNLFISKEGDKAYFEVNYFKGKLNAVKYAVYAKLKKGKWVFKSEILAIS